MRTVLLICLIAILALLLHGCATYQHCTADGECLTVRRFASSEQFSKVSAHGENGRVLEIEGFKSDQTRALEILQETLLQGGAKAAKGGL